MLKWLSLDLIYFDKGFTCITGFFLKAFPVSKLDSKLHVPK